MDSGFLITNHGGQNGVTQYIWSAERKNCDPEAYTPQKYPSVMKGKSRYFQMKKN